MRKSIWTVLLTALIALLTAGCDMAADYSVLQGQVNNLDQRVSALEQAVQKINKETVPGLQNLVNAINQKLTILSVVEGDGEYTITFSDGTTAVLRDGVDGIDGVDGADGQDGQDGKDGKDGDDGKTPVISIAMNEDGVYCWTVNGAWLLDGDGNKVPVTTPGPQGPQGPQGDPGEPGEPGEPGASGKDGNTPLFGTSSDHKLIVSYDNGATWQPVGLSIIDGSGFTSAYIDEEKSTEDYIVLVVGDTEVQIPKEKAFALKIEYTGDLGSVGINGGSTLALPFTVEGAGADDDVTVDVLSATAGLNARISANYILITADEGVNSGKVFVFADNNKGKTNIKVIKLEEGVLEAIADVSAQVGPEGGEIALKVNTNKQYNVFISEGDESWLSVEDAASKAVRTDNLVIKVAPNATGAYREGSVTITDDATGETIESFVILQQPNADVATDIYSIRSLSDGTAVAGKDAVVLASSKEGALVVDADGAYIYLKKDGNTAVRGDKVSFAGVKNTTEDTKVKYVEADLIEVTASGQEVTDLEWMYIGAGENYNSINSGSSGILEKDEKGWFITAPMGSPIYIEEPLDIDLAALEGKVITIKGYTNGATSEFYGFIVNSVEEVVFELNPNWTLSFEGEVTESIYTMDEILNTVSGGSDYYAIYGNSTYPVSMIEQAGSLENLAAYESMQAADWVQYYMYAYQQTIDDNASIETGSFYPDAKGYGEFVAFAVGVTEEGYVSGKYAVLQYTKEDPHKKLAYAEWLGNWKVGGVEWTINPNVEGESYTVLGAISYNNLELEFDGLYVDGSFAFMEKDFGPIIEGYEHVTMGGEYYSNTEHWGLNDNLTEPSVIFSVTGLKDGSFEITPGQLEGYGKYNYMSLWGLKADGSKTEFAYKKMPTIWEWVDPSVEPSPLEKNYTASDIIAGISLDKLTSTNWIYYARTDGEIAEDRNVVGYVTFTVADDAGTLVNASGMLGEDMPGQLQFRYNNGFIYNTSTYVGNYGSYYTYSLRPVVLNSSGGVYSSLYQNWLGGGYVNEGILALVDVGAYSSQGVETAGFGVGAFSGNSYAGWWEKFGHILLLDPAVYGTSSVSASAATGQSKTIKAGDNVNSNLRNSERKEFQTAEQKVPATQQPATITRKVREAK